jgi:hypothetical protein
METAVMRKWMLPGWLLLGALFSGCQVEQEADDHVGAEACSVFQEPAVTLPPSDPSSAYGRVLELDKHYSVTPPPGVANGYSAGCSFLAEPGDYIVFFGRREILIDIAFDTENWDFGREVPPVQCSEIQWRAAFHVSDAQRVWINIFSKTVDPVSMVVKKWE